MTTACGHNRPGTMYLGSKDAWKCDTYRLVNWLDRSINWLGNWLISVAD